MQVQFLSEAPIDILLSLIYVRFMSYREKTQIRKSRAERRIKKALGPFPGAEQALKDAGFVIFPDIDRFGWRNLEMMRRRPGRFQKKAEKYYNRSVKAFDRADYVKMNKIIREFRDLLFSQYDE